MRSFITFFLFVQLVEVSFQSPFSLADIDISGIDDGSNVKKPTIFFTIDDGPGKGFGEAVRTFIEAETPVTHFINGVNLEGDLGAAGDLLAAVSANQLIADHSYDHRLTEDNRNHFRGVEKDMEQFHRPHTQIVIAEMQREFGNIITNDQLAAIHTGMMSYARLPFTNNWRVIDVTSTDGGQMVDHSCTECSIPIASGQNAKKLADALWEEGTQVIGWDTEWNMGESAEDIEEKVMSVTYPFITGKIVILSHAEMFATIHGQKQLKTFLDKMKADGYVFKTVADLPIREADQYDEDEFY